MVIEVSFKGNRREFFEWPFEDAPAVKTPVIVEVERGEDLGRVHAAGELALTRKAGTTHGKAAPDPLRKAIRAANGDEIARAVQLRADELNVRTRAIEKVRTLGLDLKVSDTEWQWDKKRLTVYFTAEQRVDFRQLVRQLEGLFGTRVHMWHIGVRDEARRVDGVGRCGRQLCSASWLPELTPVKSSVAKDQRLSTINPAQISGACGRLMCCLRYEHEFYVQQRKRFPKEGKIISTLAGEEKVVSLDIFRETVTLRPVAGESRVVALAQLQQELRGEPVGLVEPHDTADTADAVDEESGDAMREDSGDERVEARDDGAAAISSLAVTDERRPVREASGPQPASGPPPDAHGGGGRRRRRGRRGGRRGGHKGGPGRGPDSGPGSGPASGPDRGSGGGQGGDPSRGPA